MSRPMVGMRSPLVDGFVVPILMSNTELKIKKTVGTTPTYRKL